MRILVLRIVVISSFMAVATGCSMLGELPLDGGRTPDPSRIHLQGTDVVSVRRTDVEDYACATGPLVCDGGPTELECRCGRW